MKMMSVRRLAKLHSHAEYGGKLIGEMTEDDLSHDGDWHGSFEELRQSIVEKGIQKPLEITKYESGEMNLRNGHHRAVIALQIGLESVPVVILD